MQTINHGTHNILPAAVPANSRPDRARVPVTMPRQTDGKMRLDGSGAAKGQPEYPVDERGRVQGASQLEAAKSKRAICERPSIFSHPEGETNMLRRPAETQSIKRA